MTCEQLKALTGYLKSKKMLVQGHYVIPQCAGTDNTYLKM
jgi:serine/threonine protein kinase